MREMINDLAGLFKNPRLLFVYGVIALFQIGLSAVAINEVHKHRINSIKASQTPMNITTKVEMIKEDIEEIVRIPNVKM